VLCCGKAKKRWHTNMKRNKTLILALAALYALAVIGCTGTDKDAPVVSYNIPAPADRAEEILSQLSLEAKVGQMFFVDTSALASGTRAVTSATVQSTGSEKSIDFAQTDALQAYKPGGVVFFSGNVESAAQVSSYINALQASSELPLFIAADQEGGSVDRLSSIGVFDAGDMSKLGREGDTHKAELYGWYVGSDMASLGFNVNFAPVCDLNSYSSVTAVRSFSADAGVAGDMAAAFVRGLARGGVAATLKHFPGHGETSADSHDGLPVAASTEEEITSRALLPFEKAIEAGAPFVMAGHISFPNIDASGRPASMSAAILTGILREEMGYEGIIITDALDMGAILENYTARETVKYCVEAGVDMLLMPQEYYTAYDALLEMAKSGEVSEARIDASVLRILREKLRLGLIR